MHLKVQVLSLNMNLVSSQQRVARSSYPFRGKFGDQVKGRSQKNLKQLIVVPHVAHLRIQVLSCNMNLISSPQQAPRPSYPFLKVQVLSLNMNLISSRQRVPRPSCPFREKLGDQVKGRSLKKLKSLIVVPYVAHMKIQVRRCNMNLFSSPQRVPRLSCAFWEKFGRTDKGSFTEKARIVDRGSLSSAPESTGSNLQYEPFLFPVACSQTELPFQEKFRRSGKMLFTKKAKILDSGY